MTAMARFDVMWRDGTTHTVVDADAYQQEGPMTTFFRTDGPGGRVDSWSTRMASVRTAEILVIHRRDEAVVAPLARPA